MVEDPFFCEFTQLYRHFTKYTVVVVIKLGLGPTEVLGLSNGTTNIVFINIILLKY